MAPAWGGRETKAGCPNTNSPLDFGSGLSRPGQYFVSRTISSGLSAASAVGASGLGSHGRANLLRDRRVAMTTGDAESVQP